jgi:hypothetical protein
MLPLFAYLALSQAAVPPRPIDLHYAPISAPAAAMICPQALQPTSSIIDLKEAAFGVLDRSAPAIARYARGPIVVLPLFAPTVERDTAYGAALSFRMP